MTQVAVNSLIQAVETWRPNDSGDRFEWSSGTYGGDFGLQEARSGRSWSVGEGIVGQAAEQRVPVIQATGEAGMDDELQGLAPTHLVAIPAMQNDACRGVVTLLCTESDHRQGAIEVWRPNERSELAITDSWYANLEHFGLVSQFVKFPRRAGMPGKVWEDRFARVMGSLGTSKNFVRAAGAKAEGLSTAVGIPIMRSAREIEAVLLMLSTQQSPIASLIEVWAPDPKTNALRVVSADYGPYVDLGPAGKQLQLGEGEGVAGRVFADGAPWVTSDLAAVESMRGESFIEYGFEWCVGLPIYVGRDLFGVVTLTR